ncbi:MAG: 50S ribosomal protein L6 [Vampirovibrionales bacterium]|nr:50S ribosomal protein L6 [Vampirovibrionales bacterium]
MSRIGKLPIELPAKVTLTTESAADGFTKIVVKGPQGELTRLIRPEISVALEGTTVQVGRKADDRKSRALHGLSRTLIANMVIGVSQGFAKNMEMVGVGYRAAVAGQTLTMQLGYSNPVVIELPKTIKATVEANTKLKIEGADKEEVGQVCANIRAFRPPEPYKGKGVRFAGEKVRRKAGKAGKK